MTANDDILHRIAAALERLAPPPAPPCDWLAAPAYVWTGAGQPVAAIEAPALARLTGIDQQKERVVANVTRLARGHAAHVALRGLPPYFRNKEHSCLKCNRT